MIKGNNISINILFSILRNHWVNFVPGYHPCSDQWASLLKCEPVYPVCTIDLNKNLEINQ